MSGEDKAAGEVVQGSLGSFLKGSGGSAFGWVSLGASLLSGSSINKSGASGQAESGAAFFNAQNDGGIKKPFLALDNPVSVLIAAGVVIGAVYLVKKMRGK